MRIICFFGFQNVHDTSWNIEIFPLRYSQDISSITVPVFVEEAKLVRAQICREMPWIMKTYNLGEVTTTSAMRKELATKFREVETQDKTVSHHAGTTNRSDTVRSTCLEGITRDHYIFVYFKTG